MSNILKKRKIRLPVSLLLIIVLAMSMFGGGMNSQAKEVSDNQQIIGGETTENSEDTADESNEQDTLETVAPLFSKEPEVSEEPQESSEPQESGEPQESSEPQQSESPVPVTKSAIAELRMIFTTDLHGQITNMNFENGDTLKQGSIARVNTLIQEAREEKGKENTLLFDIGDVLYDYSTDFIYDRDETALQPVYKAMATMGYDAITLGNHEFDYELTYVQDQLHDAGLSKLCVLSNVVYSSTGKHVWNENKIIQKKIKTEDGQEITVKVGVVGETIPVLSKKRTDHTGSLRTEDMVDNTKKQAAALKKAGADIVVVLAHSGIGEEEPAKMDENVSYALTKIPEVDVVLCGHLHRNFPSLEEYPEFFELSGMDKETGLANGKNLIMVGDQGKAIGVADLKLQQTQTATETRTEIVDRASNIRNADESVPLDENMDQNMMGEWKAELTSDYNTVLAEIQQGVAFQNYFGTLEDTSAIQLVNNAKMSFALNYINSVKTAYKNHHVIATSTYERYGLSDPLQYIDFSDNFLKSYLSGMQKYKTAIYLFEVTGAQLREWVEWSASAYETSSMLENASGSGIIQSALGNGNLNQNVLQEEWKNDWSNFFIFDGMEYTIDTMKEARYDFDGNKISDSKRVKKLTVNGTNISDNTKYVVVSNRLPSKSPLMQKISEQKIYSSYERCQNIVKDYIENCAMNGTLKKLQDNNWNVEFATDKQYVVESGTNSKETAKNKEWIVDYLGEKNNYQYYEADFTKRSEEDTDGPNIVAAPVITAVTNKNVEVKVEATDGSGVVQLKQRLGKFLATADVWDSAASISGNSFTCKENGVYSILAVDAKGNRSVYYVRINNINKSILQAPEVDSFTNRKTKITGKAEAKAKIYFELQNGKKYSSTVSASGTFSYKLPAQNAGKVVYVYVSDSKGRTSARTVVNVKRTGPNKPSLSSVKTSQKTVKGKINDNYAIPMILVDKKTIYVSNDGGKELYQNSTIYNKKYKVVQTKITTSSKGEFQMTLPNFLKANITVQVFTIDSLQRSSLGTSTKVVQTVPNKPQMITTTLSNLSTKVGVYMDEKCTVYAEVNGKTYSSSSGTYSSSKKKYAFYVKIPRTNSGVKVKVYGRNSKGNSASITLTKKEMAPNTPKITKLKAKGKTIEGTVHLIGSDGKHASVSESKTKVYVKVGNKKYTAKVKDSGKFTVKVKKKLKKRTRVVYWASNVNGTGLSGSRRV